MANIINWDMHPQMATVREGVMRKEIFDEKYVSEVVEIPVDTIVKDEDFVVEIIERHIEESGVNLKEAPIIVAGGYGVGSKENFQLLKDHFTTNAEMKHFHYANFALFQKDYKIEKQEKKSSNLILKCSFILSLANAVSCFSIASKIVLCSFIARNF